MKYTVYGVLYCMYVCMQVPYTVPYRTVLRTVYCKVQPVLYCTYSGQYSTVRTVHVLYTIVYYSIQQ